MLYPVLPFQATILYDTPIQLPAVAAFHEELNLRLKRAGNSLSMAPAQAETYFTFRSDNLYLEVLFSRTKLPPEKLATALQAGINQMRNPKFAYYVDDHIETITLTVGDGRLPMPDDLRQMLQSAGFAGEQISKVVGGSTGVDPRVKISVLHSAVETVLDTIMPSPTVVHWKDTDLLYTPRDFPPTTPELPFPISLCSQPQFFNTGLTPDGHQTHAIFMRRSELLCGRTLFADTTTYSPDAILRALQVIMLSHVIGGKQIEDGATGSFDERTGFRLEFRPPHEMTPAGGIAMVIGPLDLIRAPSPSRTGAQTAAEVSKRHWWWPFGKRPTVH